MSKEKATKRCLPTFTFLRVGVKCTGFQALPGPEARALRAKTMRHASFLGPGGPPKLRIVECGMRIEKENPKIRNPQFEIQNGQADAFSAQRPCFRATSLLFSRKQTRKSEGGQAKGGIGRDLRTFSKIPRLGRAIGALHSSKF